MLNSSFLIIFFRLINVAVLIGLGYYLFKKYVKNKIEEKITQREMLEKGLEEQGYFLEGKSHTMDTQLVAQELRADRMKQKIAEWNLSMLAQKNKRQNEYEHNATVAAQRIIDKNNYIEKKAWAKSIMPELLAKSQEALRHEFATQSKADEYIHAIVQRLERD